MLVELQVIFGVGKEAFDDHLKSRVAYYVRLEGLQHVLVLLRNALLVVVHLGQALALQVDVLYHVLQEYRVRAFVL